MTRRLNVHNIGLFAALFTLGISQSQDVSCFAQAPEPIAKFFRFQDTETNVAAEPIEPLTPGPVKASVKCAGNEQMRASLKPLSEITLKVTPQGSAPPDCYARDTSSEEIWSYPASDSVYQYHWQAASLVHNPLYFEDIPLERYGHIYGPLLQPLVSGAHFWGSALTLPYRMGVDPPQNLKYTLGYHRPGSWAPSVREHLPLSAKGTLLQAGAIVGGVYLFP